MSGFSGGGGSGGAVASVNGHIGAVNLVKADVGLGNVLNNAQVKQDGTGTITTATVMTNAAYTALGSKDATTLYLIVG